MIYVAAFNIEGLNSTLAQLNSRANYALLAHLDNQVVGLALQSLSENIEHVFILSAQIELFFESPFSSQLHSLFEQGKVHPFSFDYHLALSKKLNFTRSILNELKAYDKVHNSVVFIHINTEVFVNYKENKLDKQLALYNKFSANYNLTLVFIVTGADIDVVRQQIQKRSKLFDGVLYITNDASVQTLEYDFWKHNEGIIAGDRVHVEESKGIFKVIEANDIDEQKVEETNQYFDENEVWLVQNAVPEGTKLPLYYKVVMDNEALYKQGYTMKAATLIFSVTRYTDLVTLVRQCFSLRKHCGKKLKLVIQNVDGIIRHQDECLFLTLGVNLILYSFSKPSRLLSQIQSIQGFHFSRPLPSSIDDVLQYSESALAKGFLPFSAFIQQVATYSNSAANLGVRGVLVVLKLLPRIEAIHPLHLFHVKREGDIFSTIDNHIYLYLHACREHDVEQAIKHLFKLEISDFFESKSLISDHFFIQQECRRLKVHYENTEAPDYTEELKENISYTFDAQLADMSILNTETPEFKKVIRPLATKCEMVLKEANK